MKKHVKHFLLSLTSKIAARFNLELVNKDEIKARHKYTLAILDELGDNSNNFKIDSIVFSKDRAMQLHAFLSSYKTNVKNRGRMIILYLCSNERHKRSYEQLKSLFSDEDFFFIEEKQFRDQLIEICAQSEAGKIIFFVDDMIFTHEIDYELIGKIDTTKSIVVLSRGKDLNFSVVLQKEIKRPPFTATADNLNSFRWNFQQELSDWTYPLGVSGYMYGMAETLWMLKSGSFKAPNSLENSMQSFLPYFINRIGLCPEYASCICVHANLVQTEGKNPDLGTFSIEDLLEKWEEGKRINLKEFYNKPMNIAQVQKYQFDNA